MGDQGQAEGPGSQVEHDVGDQGQAEEAQRYPEDAQDTHEGALRGTDSPGADQYDDVVYDVDLSDSGEDAQGDASLNHKREAHSDTDASLKDSEAAPTGNEASMDAKLKVTIILCQPSCNHSLPLCLLHVASLLVWSREL